MPVDTDRISRSGHRCIRSAPGVLAIAPSFREVQPRDRQPSSPPDLADTPSTQGYNPLQKGTEIPAKRIRCMVVLFKHVNPVVRLPETVQRRLDLVEPWCGGRHEQGPERGRQAPSGVVYVSKNFPSSNLWGRKCLMRACWGSGRSAAQRRLLGIRDGRRAGCWLVRGLQGCKAR